MEAMLKTVKGSDFADEFRYWHKNQLPSWCYGCDFDFVLVVFDDNPLKAVIDIKSPSDIEPTKTTARAYRWFEDTGIPVFLLWPVDYLRSVCDRCGHDDVTLSDGSRMKIKRYESGAERILEKDEFIEWQGQIRGFRPESGPFWWE